MIPKPEPSEIEIPVEENPVRDESLESYTSDNTVEILVEDESGEFSTAAVELPAVATSDVLITIEEATARLGPEILETLRERFNGELTEVRHIDERDRII